MRFGYADPPYPGLARKYYGPEASEVNHRVLIGTLEAEYPDGWALSTSAAALPSVLALCPADARVCVWVKGAQASVGLRPHNAWEPLIVVRGRPRRVTAAERVTDTLIWGGRQHSHPGALVGMKPAAFCEWAFCQLGAEVGDSLDDIFPGSAAVERAWKLYTSRLPGDPSRGDDVTSRLEEAQIRLGEQLHSSRLQEGGTGATHNLEGAETDPSREYSSTELARQ
jgi:hypothetical protein